MEKKVKLTIDFDGLDTDSLLADWRWLVPMELCPVQMTKFGDWFFRGPAGQVYMLDLIEGELSQVADTIEEFNELIDEDEKRSEWYLDGFVFRCHEEGLHLSPQQCYGWKIHPLIGGKFEFENIQMFDLLVYQTLMGQLLRQWKALKPGQPIPPITLT